MTDGYGYSSHYMFSPEMESGFIDHLLLRPHTGWRGTRGMRVNFGEDDMDEFGEDFDEFGHDFDDFGEDDLDEFGEDEEEEDFGILGIALTRKAKERKALRKKGRRVRKAIKKRIGGRGTEDLQERLRRLKAAMAQPGRIKTVQRRGGKTSQMTKSDLRKRIRMTQRELAKRGAAFGFDVDDEYGEDDAALEAELDALDAELDEEIFGDEDYGRLYMSPEGYYPKEASPADHGAILGRSGSSGFRGGRPTFGARVDVPLLGMSYEGSELGAFAIAMGGLAVAGKALKLF